jgi:hypothetical protein
VTVNNYEVSAVRSHEDIRRGPAATEQWTGFHPLIADFLTENAARLETVKRAITEDEWRRAEELALEYLARSPALCRDGRPRFSRYPAGSVKEGVIAFIVMALVVTGAIAAYLWFT